MNLRKSKSLALIAILASGVFGLEHQASAVNGQDPGDNPKTFDSNAIVKFKADTKPTKPTDPDNPDTDNPVSPWDPTTPDNKPNPGTAGPLSLDYASSIDFGENLITDQDMIYYAEPQYLFAADGVTKDPNSARPNYVQVSDNRGTNSGWTLRVSQNGQLSNNKTLNKELTGSQIRFTSGVVKQNKEATMPPIPAPVNKDFTLNPDGTEVEVMTAADGTGMGTWVNRFGTLEDVDINGETVKKNKAITLSIPGNILKDAVEYRTSLTWRLYDVPTADFDNPNGTVTPTP